MNDDDIRLSRFTNLPLPDPPELPLLELEPSWAKTDTALAALLNLILLVGVLLAPALVWYVWGLVL